MKLLSNIKRIPKGLVNLFSNKAPKKKRKIFIRPRLRMLRFFDWPLLICMLCLIVIGILSIAAATSAPITDESSSMMDRLSKQTLYYPRLQLIWTFIGLALGVFVLAINYKFVASKTNWIYWLNILLLLFVLAQTRMRGNMAGWYRFGDRTFQPSEVAKIAIILGLARRFSLFTHPLSDWKEVAAQVIYVAIPLLLIAAQPDFGTAIVYVFIFSVMIFVSGAKLKPLFEVALVLLAIAAVGAFLYVRSGSDSFRIERVLVWLNSENVSADSRLQTENALLAVGSGSVTGKGMYSPGAMGQLGYIPDDHTDFVFSITCETFGFVGGFAVIALFTFMFARMLHLSRIIEDRFASLTIVGIMAMMLFHTFENIGMVIGVMPVTGIPLPFMSYGGSSLLTNMLSMFIVLNLSMVCRYRQDLRRRKQERVTMQNILDGTEATGA